MLPKFRFCHKEARKKAQVLSPLSASFLLMISQANAARAGVAVF